ncbi:hypothetical protein KI688_002828 [Linnemannia hyalina]|uniref:Uncharacterized protein n=1 Tax=Linnemannia hyalina TaxID=64524 RepID=A0A9P8BQM9_9FUNG|nr:hypothetical protein KI688_002828 [Linnemannia hyalina]
MSVSTSTTRISKDAASSAGTGTEGMVFPERKQSGHMGPNPGGSKAAGVQRWVKRVVVGVPVTVQEAIARRAKRVGFDGKQQRDIASTNANSSLLVSNESDTDSQVSSNRVRRILFKSCLLSFSTFHRLVKECHNLDEIVLGGRSFTPQPYTWIVLSAQCPGLRIIRIQECDYLEPLPGVSTFIGMFLRLEELEFNAVMFDNDPDDLHDGLDVVLKEHESLTVGRIDVPNYIGETESASEPLSTSAQARYEFKDSFRLKHNDPERREIKYRRKVWRDMALRYCGLWFATVEKLTIRPRFQCYSPVEAPDEMGLDNRGCLCDDLLAKSPAPCSSRNY